LKTDVYTTAESTGNGIYSFTAAGIAGNCAVNDTGIGIHTRIDASATIAGNRATDDSGRGGVWNQTGALIVRNGAVRNGEALCVESSNTAAGIARYDAPFDVSLVGTV
jgi:hypothetical protein